MNEDEAMLLKSVSTGVRMFFIGVDALTLTLQISANGGSFAAPTTPALVNVVPGWYSWTYSTTDTGTPGSLAYVISGAGLPPIAGFPTDQVYDPSNFITASNRIVVE